MTNNHFFGKDGTLGRLRFFAYFCVLWLVTSFLIGLIEVVRLSSGSEATQLFYGFGLLIMLPVFYGLVVRRVRDIHGHPGLKGVIAFVLSFIPLVCFLAWGYLFFVPPRTSKS